MHRYPLDLTGALVKLDRAAEHIRFLVGEVDAFQKDNPLTTFAEFEANRDFLVKVRVPQTPDLQWGVVLGDAVHNLRSALDHAAWELVQRNVRAGFKPVLTEKQERLIQYPISDDRARFKTAPVMRFLTTRQIALLRRYQPYRRPSARSHTSKRTRMARQHRQTPHRPQHTHGTRSVGTRAIPNPRESIGGRVRLG